MNNLEYRKQLLKIMNPDYVKPKIVPPKSLFENKTKKKCPKGYKICRCDNKPKPIKFVENCKKTIKYNKRFINKKYK